MAVRKQTGSIFMLLLLILVVPQIIDGAKHLPRYTSRSECNIAASNPIEINRDTEVRQQLDSAMWPVYKMYTVFVGSVVQPQRFDQIANQLNWTSFESIAENIEATWQDIVIYFIGFVVLVALGLVAFLVMLPVAIFLPCCRCCNKCGGKNSKKEGKHSKRDRLGCGITLLIFNCILILGAVCIFVSNERIHDQLTAENHTLFDNIATGINEIGPFLNDTVGELDCEVHGRFIETRDEVFDELYQLPTETINKFDNETRVLEGFNALDVFSGNLSSLNHSLFEVDDNAEKLQDESLALNMTLNQLRDHILKDPDLSDCTTTECNAIKQKVKDLYVAVDYTLVNVNNAKFATNLALQNEFHILIAYISSNITGIISEINQTTYDSISSAYEQSEEIEDEITGLIADLREGVNELDLSQVTDIMNDTKSTVTEMGIDFYIYFGIAVLGSALCLIVFFNLIGLLHGAACGPPEPDEACTTCSMRQGSHWLLASNGITLFFFWIFALVLALTFALGGAVYTEVCRNIVFYEDSKSSEVLVVLDRLLLNTINNDSADPMNIEVFESYKRCGQGETIYTALKLAENGFNLSTILDLSAVEEAIEEIKNIPIDIPEVTLTDPTLNTLLAALDLGIALDFEGMVAILEKSVTITDPVDLANDLQALNFPGLNTSIIQLYEVADTINNMTVIARETQSQLEDVVIPITYSINFAELGSILNYSELFITVNGSQFASSIVDETADGVMISIDLLVSNLINDVENNIAKCVPLYTSFTSVIDAACVQALYPLNAFWFSLGWCFFFLIPHLVLSFKLSKLYRKTEPYASRSRKPDDDDMTLQRMPDARQITDRHHIDPDYQQWDNLAFDQPMDAYRKELMMKNGGKPLFESSEKKRYPDDLLPPPYEPFSYTKGMDNPWIIPRPRNVHKPRDHMPVADYDQDRDFLFNEVPLPDYGDENSEDGILAKLY